MCPVVSWERNWYGMGHEVKDKCESELLCHWSVPSWIYQMYTSCKDSHTVTVRGVLKHTPSDTERQSQRSSNKYTLVKVHRHLPKGVSEILISPHCALSRPRHMPPERGHDVKKKSSPFLLPHDPCSLIHITLTCIDLEHPRTLTLACTSQRKTHNSKYN